MFFAFFCISKVKSLVLGYAAITGYSFKFSFLKDMPDVLLRFWGWGRGGEALINVATSLPCFHQK